jgi:hypothetical protein
MAVGGDTSAAGRSGPARRELAAPIRLGNGRLLLLHLDGGGLAEARFEDGPDQAHCRDGPEYGRESREDGVGASSTADGAAAEQELAQKDAESDAAEEVEECVEQLDAGEKKGDRCYVILSAFQFVISVGT